ncbi:hypothetical protein CYLTODRAFT_375893 [Cylindrobasidium torrendii FP15055 ss-10]|uniref:Autophagy-related protein 27 n=1 Tax=Cylindrobasidium torrendii FP15055 ss-10 TaxID=1314674 RepID=A0A0D7BDB7_9AGAR|nr:hypothetical protein CYLTODRAFT_375893 [Cylindrobasidium torrendii FP15055 ss-10]
MVSSSALWTFILPVLTTVAAQQDFPCSFELDNFAFDLCPLVRGRNAIALNVEEDTPPTKTTSRYSISVDGSLIRDRTLPKDLTCPDDTWICLEVSNTRPNRPSEPERITQIVPIAIGSKLVPKAKFGIKRHESDVHAPLRVILHGGTYTGRRQKALFEFVCDHDAEPSSPTFAWSFNGTHAFDWRSKHACGELISGTPTKGGPETQPDDQPPQDPDKDSGELSPTHRPRGVLWTFLLLGAIFLFFVLRKRSASSILKSLERSITSVRRHAQMRWQQGGHASNNHLEWTPEYLVLPADDEMPLSPTMAKGLKPFHYGSVG